VDDLETSSKAAALPDTKSSVTISATRASTSRDASSRDSKSWSSSRMIRQQQSYTRAHDIKKPK
jgi:hypothetical protein